MKPAYLTFSYGRNDLTLQKRAEMNKILTKFGPNQKSEFVHPAARLIIRCPFCGCGKPINSHGIDTTIAAHFRSAHKDLPNPIIALIQEVCGATLTSHLIPSRIGTRKEIKGVTNTAQQMQPPQEIIGRDRRQDSQHAVHTSVHDDAQSSIDSLGFETDSLRHRPGQRNEQVDSQATAHDLSVSHGDKHSEATDPIDKMRTKTVLNKRDRSHPNRPNSPMSPRPHACHGSNDGEGSSTHRCPSNSNAESQHAGWLEVAAGKNQEEQGRKAEQNDEDPLTGNQ